MYDITTKQQYTYLYVKEIQPTRTNYFNYIIFEQQKLIPKWHVQ